MTGLVRHAAAAYRDTSRDSSTRRPAGWRTLFIGLVTGLVLSGLVVTAVVADAAAQPVSSAPSRADDLTPADPLQVRIESINPSVVPARGPLTAAGTVTNTSSETWTDLFVYLVTSAQPVTSSADLADAAATPPDADIGPRLTENGLFVQIPDLAPGASASYRLRVPRARLGLSGAPGVYWLGVHVLGTADGVRTDGADGRARTFVALLPKRNPPRTTLALLLPMRGRVLTDAAGRVADPATWRRKLSARGRFGRLLTLSESSGTFPLTWVLDPALLDVMGALARDNPPLDLGASLRGTGPSASPSAVPSTPAVAAPTAAARRASAFLDRFRSEAGRRGVLALPYADLDVVASTRLGLADLVRTATRLGADSLADARIPSRPVLVPPAGTMPWETLAEVDPAVPVVLQDRYVEGARGPRVDTSDGVRLTLASTDAGSGGPAPTPAYDALAVRQRILAEAALHALSSRRDEPMVVSLPEHWNPGSSWRRSRFFAGLRVPWLGAVSGSAVLGSPTAQAELPDGSGRLRYPDTVLDAELPQPNLDVTGQLVRTGKTLETLLRRNATVDDRLAGLALLGSSVQLRDHPVRARLRTQRVLAHVTALMRRVTVSGPRFVTMSSEQGPFQVTIHNGLDQPVRAGVIARALGTNRLTFPTVAPVDIPPGQRRSVRMQASSSGTGVWQVVLEPVAADGTPLGYTADFKLRSSHVGLVIWAVLGIGSLVLLVAIGFRIRRQVRQRRATHGPLLGREA